MAQQVREVGDLLQEVSGDIQRLIRDEVRLARVELTENLRQAVIGFAGLAVAAAMAYLGVVFVGVAVFFAIFLAIPGWAAGLAVAAGYFIIAALAFVVARQRLRPSQILPDQTIESLEEDREWLERRMR